MVAGVGTNITAHTIPTYPVLAKLNIMGLHTPQSAVLSAVIFNALIIIALVPLALRGVKYRPLDAASLLRLRSTVAREIPSAPQSAAVMPLIGGMATTASVKAHRRPASSGSPAGRQVFFGPQ